SWGNRKGAGWQSKGRRDDPPPLERSLRVLREGLRALRVLEVDACAQLEEPLLQNVRRTLPLTGGRRRERAADRVRPAAVEHVIQVDAAAHAVPAEVQAFRGLEVQLVQVEPSVVETFTNQLHALRRRS